MDVGIGISAGNAEISSQGTDNPIVEKIHHLRGTKFLVRKGLRGHIRGDDGEVLIYRLEKSQRKTELCEILAISDGCQLLKPEHVGKFLHCAIWGPHMTNLGNDYWILDEKLIKDGIRTTHVKPFVIGG